MVPMLESRCKCTAETFLGKVTVLKSGFLYTKFRAVLISKDVIESAKKHSDSHRQESECKQMADQEKWDADRATQDQKGMIWQQFESY